MHSQHILPRPRLVASGGPVSRAVEAGRGEERPQADRLRSLAESIRHRIGLDFLLLASVERAAARISSGDLA